MPSEDGHGPAGWGWVGGDGGPPPKQTETSACFLGRAADTSLWKTRPSVTYRDGDYPVLIFWIIESLADLSSWAAVKNIPSQGHLDILHSGSQAPQVSEAPDPVTEPVSEWKIPVESIPWEGVPLPRYGSFYTCSTEHFLGAGTLSLQEWYLTPGGSVSKDLGNHQMKTHIVRRLILGLCVHFK